MPSKYRNGNNPTGQRIRNVDSPASVAAQVELQIGRIQPSTSLQSGSMQLPNGRVQMNRKARGGSGAVIYPWRVSLTKGEQGGYTARISEGSIYDGLLSVTAMAFETVVVGEITQSVGQGSTVVANDVVCIKYTYPSGPTPAKIEFATVNAGAGFANWEAIEETGDPAVITATRYPLAKIIDAGNSTLEVEQIATANLALIPICYKGQPVTTLTPY